MSAERLNEGERRCLELLARGYDIKGIAAETGLSVNAVNERLRSARAKLGTTSSRAAARALVQGGEPSQKIWDSKSGVPPAADPVQPVRTGRALWPLGVFAMLTVLALAAAALAPSKPAAPEPAAPRVVSTYPADGTVIAPGPFTLRVTFDRPMMPASYSFVTTDLGVYPACTGKPVQSRDGRSFSLLCRAAPGTAYAVGFNYGRFSGFRAAGGAVPARPAVIRFRSR